MQIPTNFCVAPFLQTTTHPTGSFSPCPYLGGTTWFANHATIRDQWLDPKLQELRQDFISNKKSIVCNRCWNEEANNKRSLRLRLYDPKSNTSDYQFAQGPEFAEQFVKSLEDGSYLRGPRVLTIKNGNICNARCRTCYPECSSKWITDVKKLIPIIPDAIYNNNLEEHNWSQRQVDEIVELSPNLHRLELFGGEPFYNKKVSTMLQRIVEVGHADHIVLYVNTNGSVNFLDKMPWLFKFKSLEIGVSIDGVDRHFNYIRNGLDYQKVISHTEIWQKTLAGTNFWLDCITTVNIFNVFYLPEIKTKITSILPLAPFWNLLVEPAYLYIKHIPEHAKLKIIKKLSRDHDEFHDLINVLQQPGDEREWARFWQYTRALDSIRSESFEDIFPEFSAILRN